MSVALSNDELKKLREKKLLGDNDVAMLEGDLIAAENVVTRERRVLGTKSNLMLENNRRILFG